MALDDALLDEADAGRGDEVEGKPRGEAVEDEADHYHEITKEDWFTLAPKKTKTRKAQGRRQKSK